MKDQERVEFHPPQEASVPEGNSGEEFDLVCTFRRKPDGRVCLTMFGDVPMPGYGKDKDAREKMYAKKPDYSGYVGNMQQAAAPGGGGQSE